MPLRLLAQCLTAVMLAGGLALPAQAEHFEPWQLRAEGPKLRLIPDGTERNGEREQRAIISREQAVRRALGEYPGKVLSVKLRGGGEFYAVKIINKGRVRVVRVPAQR
ncbi:MAG: hypothetical protein R3352_10835 [Salinisphaeraceae bacterium]|nr:hypothetical protein [Salinisphaeraceae bacterium]